MGPCQANGAYNLIEGNGSGTHNGTHNVSSGGTGEHVAGYFSAPKTPMTY